MTIKKAYSIADIDKRKFTTISLSKELEQQFGIMERSGSVILFAGPGNGKTSLALQLAKAVCQTEKVLYNTAEEGITKSFQRSLALNNMKSVASKFKFVKEKYADFNKRLALKRQPKVVVIDSVQYFFRGKKVQDYFNFIEKYNNTLFIWLSHQQKGAPKGTIAAEIAHDCQNLIHVQDFKAHILKSRCGADQTKPYVIVKELAEQRELQLVKKG